jgi:hypothetical protein
MNDLYSNEDLVSSNIKRVTVRIRAKMGNSSQVHVIYVSMVQNRLLQ